MSDWEVAAPPTPISTDWQVDKAQPAKPVSADTMSFMDIAKGAYKNFGKSAVNFAKDTVTPIVHPLRTMEDLGKTALGAVEKTGITPHQESVPYADAVGKFVMDRYGSVENFKKTVAKDPVGFLGDLSMLFSGGETALARAPGALGKAGEVAGTVGRAINPITGPAKAIGAAVTKGAPGLIGEMATHTGAESLMEAAKQGYQGGPGNQKFLAHMRGDVPASEAVDEARMGLAGLRRDMSASYQAEIAPILQDPKVLDFNKIDQSLSDVAGIQTFKGLSGTGPTQVLNKPTEGIRKAMTDVIDHWRTLDPADYHTIAGFDAMKKELQAAYQATEQGTPQRKVAGQIYNAVKDSIVDQDARYGKVMATYEDDINEIHEIDRELSLGEKATVGTALRKLQSIMRNNASSAYKHRKELGERLEQGGADQLKPIIAGQALNPWFPRGLGRMIPAAIGGGAAESMMAGHHGVGPAAVAAGAVGISSPRLMGQAANKAGMAARPFKYVSPGKAGLSLFETGQMTSPLDTPAQQGPQSPWVPISE